ncbi:MAG: HEAT repeat domain-containing protein [Cyanobacteriota bacterium]
MTLPEGPKGPPQPDLSPLIAAVDGAHSAESLVQATRTLALALATPPSEPTAVTPEMLNAIRTLVGVMGFNNPGAAVAAVDGLMACGPAAVEPLLEGLDNHNYGARAWAVRALAGIGDGRGLDLLEEALQGDIGPSVRRAAARGLGQLRLETIEAEIRTPVWNRCLGALERGSQDDEWVVRYAVVVGLESLGHSPHGPRPAPAALLECLERLSQPAQEAIPVVRLRAQLALDRLGPP